MVTTWSSSGLAQSFEHVRGNSGSSSRKSTPWWAREISPGRGIIRRRRWRRRWRCGAACARGRATQPLTRFELARGGVDGVIWIASSGVSGGSTPGSALAIIVLPVPAGPSMTMLCPPAAATTITHFTLSCPLISAKSIGAAAGSWSNCATSGTGTARLEMTGQQANDFRERADAEDIETLDDGGLGGVVVGDDNALVAAKSGECGERNGAFDGTQAAVEREFHQRRENRARVDARRIGDDDSGWAGFLRAFRSRGDALHEQHHRDGQVVDGAFFANVGGREVDGARPSGKK